jgi:hypothetical protein
MRVELSTEVIAAPAPVPSAIQAVGRLLESFDQSRHFWVVDPETEPTLAQYLHRHFPSLAQTYLKLAETAAVQSTAWTGTTQRGRTFVVTRSDLEDHAADLCRAAILVVENLPGDKYFVLAVVHAFRRDAIREAFEQGWVEFRHGGGSGSVAAVAEEAAGFFRRQARVAVLYDSDSMHPEDKDEQTNWPKAVRLREKGIPAHVLIRREAENYAPDKVLAVCGRQSEAVERLKHLATLLPHQRGHYDMKNGLPVHDHPKQRELFAGLTPQSRQGLRSGFGRQVLNQMFELRDDLREADFEEMDAEAAADLRTLLALIESLI